MTLVKSESFLTNGMKFVDAQRESPRVFAPTMSHHVYAKRRDPHDKYDCRYMHPSIWTTLCLLAVRFTFVYMLQDICGTKCSHKFVKFGVGCILLSPKSRLTCRCYEQSVPGPTLSLQPGKSSTRAAILSIRLKSNLASSDFTTRHTC